MSIANDNDIAASAPTAAREKPGPVLVADGLRVDATNGDAIVQDVSFQLEAGTILGVVGESGSGKTTTALALLGYTQGGARISAGEVTIAGRRIDARDAKGVRRLRGRFVSYVPQNPATALNPSLRVGDAIREMVRAHRSGETTPPTSIAGAFEQVGLPGTEQFLHRYPHQLSGGQQQRVCISVSLVCEPPVVVLDEPTTGLDVVTQARILEELVRLAADQDIAMVYVTHDLAVVAQIADRIAVMYGGHIVEQGPARQVLSRPRHPYTRGLLRSIPDHLRPGALVAMPGLAVGIGDRAAGCRFAARCELATEECSVEVPQLTTVGTDDHTARCIHADIVAAQPATAAPAPLVGMVEKELDTVLTVRTLRAEHRSRRETVVAAEDVSFTIRRGECVALVGESGSGKTTIARTISGLHPIGGGEVLLDGVTLPALARRRSREQRRRVQIVFQNPTDALNPRQTIGTAIGRPARLLRDLDRNQARAEVTRLLDLVRLPGHLAGRLPTQLSGGEKQRVSIARALAADPSVIVCDEITSALDVSVQAAVLELLAELRRELGLALLFITHDLGVVANIADQVLVLEGGRVAEQGPTRTVLGNPAQAYTQRLLESAPSVSHALDLWSQWDERTRPSQ